MDIDKFKELGEQCGLTGSDLLQYVESKQREILDREERYLEREIMKEEGERKAKLEMLEKEIELQQLRNARVDSETENGQGHTDRGSGKVRCPKLPPFEESRDNIDSYLQRFERFAESVKWKREDWPINISALLKGKALEVYSRLSPSQANDYQHLKQALLRRFQLTEEGFRLKFRNGKPESGETFSQFSVRIDNYLMRWIDMSETPHDFETLKDLLLREQFINASPKSLALFLKERKPQTIKAMSELADQYMEAHQGPDISKPVGLGKPQQSNTRGNSDKVQQREEDTNGRRCYVCQKKGHIAKECKKKFMKASAAVVVDSAKANSYQCGGNNTECKKNWKKNGKDFKKTGDSGKKSETSAMCISNPDPLGDCCVKDNVVKLECGHHIPFISVACGNSKAKGRSDLPLTEGLVGEQSVAVLRDTGCTGVVVRKDIVAEKDFTGEVKVCMLIDGTVRKVPVAEIYIDTPYFTGTVHALCFEKPVYDLVVGNIEGVREPSNPDPLWCHKRHDNDIDQSIDITSVDRMEQTGAIQTRAQLKAEQRIQNPLKVPSAIDFPLNRDNLQAEQEQDETIAHFYKSPDRKRADGSTVSFVEHRGLLYRIYTTGQGVRATKQLVVPKKYRKRVLLLGHESLMAGHLGVKKTSDRIMSQFYWPGIHEDIRRFCQSCESCQRTIPKGKVGKIPLGKMPIIDQPFKRVAIDLIGPIQPVTDKKNRYILTLMDYATRYPEAVALPRIEAEVVAEALVNMFSRIGVPREILSDQGTQFTSQLMSEVSRLLSIKQLVTTPYHPMCNGMVERFNGTLKAMLRRMCVERPKDWDRYLPALLFAYREAPQASLGFSPFELLYGRTVRGPMQILKELWTKEVDAPDVKTTYEYVLDLRNRLEETCEMAKEQLEKSQATYKHHFDKKAKDRQFEVGDRVLVLLPTNENKLLMKWRGPFTILEKIEGRDYKIQVKEKTKVFHANMLKKFWERSSDEGEISAGIFTKVCTAMVEPGGYESSENTKNTEEAPLRFLETQSKENFADVKCSSDLDGNSAEELEALVSRYSDIFSDLPGHCDIVQHEIKLTSSTPIRSKPYPIPHAMKDTIREEVKTMLQMGIIQPSDSPFLSPTVLVKKPDGTNRFCIDFRKLNQVTIFDAEPMPDTDAIFAKLSESRYFSKIDLSKGYWQIPMSPECMKMTAFVSPGDGLYEFRVMPFGLVNAPATFNRMMRILLEEMKQVESFLDDILIHTVTWEEHLMVLKELFDRIRKAHLTARPSKCMLGYRSLDFLGHYVGDGTLQPHTSKVDKVQSASRPETKKQVRSFLGLVGYYRKFIPNFATVAAPLTDLTKKGKPVKVCWGEVQEVAFKELKSLLASKPILKLPDCKRPFILRTDASNVGLGAILLQYENNELFPVAYASKKLLARQQAYSTIEKEGLAIVWAVQKFHVYLYGREFELQTDHQPLVYIKRNQVANARIMRWALFLQDYRFRIVSIRGRDNVGADYLSRSFSET